MGFGVRGGIEAGYDMFYLEELNECPAGLPHAISRLTLIRPEVYRSSNCHQFT